MTGRPRGNGRCYSHNIIAALVGPRSSECKRTQLWKIADFIFIANRVRSMDKFWTVKLKKYR